MSETALSFGAYVRFLSPKNRATLARSASVSILLVGIVCRGLLEAERDLFNQRTRGKHSGPAAPGQDPVLHLVQVIGGELKDEPAVARSLWRMRVTHERTSGCRMTDSTQGFISSSVFS